jgi:uncharacterized membrane protein (UPF0127 family)
MKIIQIRNESRPGAGLLRARFCDSFLCRLRGLTFRRSLQEDEALLLVEKRESRVDASIHMLAVFMDLGVVWLNSDKEVVDTRLARRWRPAYFPRQAARYVLEFSPHRLGEYQIGDRLSFDREP